MAGFTNSGFNKDNLLWRSRSSINPISLFTQGEQGLWFDPSDITTMFQDAGTSISNSVPVTAPGQPVGLILDKSKGLAKGAETLSNGDFSNGSTGWTVTSATFNVVNGVGRHAATATNGATQNLVTLDTTKYYELVFEVKENTDNQTTSISIREAATTTQSIIIPVSAGVTGTFRGVFKPTSSASRVHIRSTAASAGYVGFDNITIREITGNHAFQTTAASKPLLARHPASGIRNIIPYSEDFTIGTGARWSGLAAGTGVSPVVTVNQATAPDGTLTADLLVLNKGAGTLNTDQCSLFAANTSVGTIAGQAYVASIWLKTSDGSTKLVRLDFNGADADSGTTSLKTVTGTWQKFEVRLSNAVDSNRGLTIRLRGTTGTSDTASLHVWGAQQELGTTPTAYQKTESLLDVTEIGVSDAWHLKFDGVDDFLATGSIDFTSGDAMSLFAALRKSSDANIGVVFEMSSDTNTNNGTTALFAPGIVGTPNVNYRSRGTILRDAAISGLAAPVTVVVSGDSDISADASRARVNGGAYTTTTGDQGTGNLGNYPIYIGRRAGTSIPLNGNIYGLILRAGLTADATIVKMEKLLASKAGVTL